MKRYANRSLIEFTNKAHATNVYRDSNGYVDYSGIRDKNSQGWLDFDIFKLFPDPQIGDTTIEEGLFIHIRTKIERVPRPIPLPPAWNMEEEMMN